MQGESGVTRSIIDELHFSDIHGGQMERENGVTRSITDEFHFSDIQRDQMECESGVTGSIIDEVHSSEFVKFKVKVVLPELSLMNFILGISNEIKWKVTVVFLEV